jgi:hypothetical protein
MTKNENAGSRTGSVDAAREWLLTERIEPGQKHPSWPQELSSENMERFWKVFDEGRSKRSKRKLPGLLVEALSNSDRPRLVGEFVGSFFLPAESGPTPLRYDAWIFFGKLARNAAGHLTLDSLSVAPLSSEFGAEGVTHRVWRAISPPKLLEAARLTLLQRETLIELKSTVHALSESDQSQLEEARDLLPGRGRPGRSSREIAGFAERWLAAQDDPSRTRAVLDVLHEQLGRSTETIKTWKRQAVERQFLTSGAPGRRAACEAGPRLRELQAGKRKEER